MKLRYPIAFSTLLAVGCAHAAISAYEPFLVGSTPANGEYTLGNATPQNPTVNGYTGAWLDSSTNSPQILASGLSYTNGSGTLTTTGGSIATTNGNTRSGHLLSTPVTGSTSTTLYMSVLIQLESVGGTNYRSFEMHNGGFSDVGNRSVQIGHGGSTTGTPDFENNQTNFGLRLNSATALRLDLGAADTNVNLFVLKFDLSDQNNSDTVTVWRNPVMGGAEPVGNNGTLTGFNMVFDRTSLARFGGDASSITDIGMDELRFGDSFAAVTPIPEPSSVGLLLVAGLGLVARRRR